uniref:Fanconi anemia group M protein n=1 Tax=Schizaphis graminum TaxID=13262 RepID=A0A2S2NCS8_SCHGA
MTDTNDQFLVEDDEILASILEESLRHYNEVEVPLRSITLKELSSTRPTQSIDVNKVLPKQTIIENEVPQQSIGTNSVPKLSSVAPPVVIDLCESPKKCAVVQSRLSHFFTKPKSVKICDEKINSELENQTEKLSIEVNSSPILNNVSIISSPAIFYKEPDADGFHLSSGSHYVYPSNFPVREYQMTIIKTALFHNTLVSLPTGMGKTFIAAVVMYNFYRWYPMGKIIFMAPTRPLVAQQIEACHSIMGIPRDMTFEMTGNIPPEQRYLAWNKYRVFFLTPQVLANDLSLNKCPSDTFRCIIVDEAHRATKDYAYVQVLKHLAEENRVIRIVGLSATPGTNIDAVTEVIQNLNISRLEFRTDESPDVAKYTNKKDVECIPVKLTNTILEIRNQFLKVYDKHLRRLKQYHALNGNVANLTKFQILGAKQKFLTSNIARDMPKSLVGCLINDFTICMSLAYALELLTIYGVKVFYLQSLEIKENHKCLANDADFQNLLHSINNELNSQDLTWSHPKLLELKKIVQNYFGNTNVEASSKIIIFCQYRLVVVEVFELLKTFGSSVKPVMFVGQSLKEKGGLPQKKQLEVMSRFKSGDFNVLIATSVAEEGLDIGEVDLIICLEANKSPIKFVQRLGRTGRKRSGKCITLLTEGKEQIKYNSSVSSSKTLVIKMLKSKVILSKLAPAGPRLVPKHIHPKCLMIHVKKPEELFPEKKKLKGKKKGVENIMRYVEPNDGQNEVDEDGEDGLNIFQNNIDKPKRRSKKRKTVELDTIDNDCREVRSLEEKNTNLDCEHNFNDYNDNNAHNINAHGVTDRSLDRFVDEEKLFNEWVQSCVQTNKIVMNSPFLELLNLFTDRGQCDTELFNNESTNDMFIEHTDLVQRSIGPSVSEERTIRVNDQPMRNVDRSFRSSDNLRLGGSQVASTSAARDINYCTENSELEDIFDGHTDQSTVMRPIGMRTSEICSSSDKTKTDTNNFLGKLDFNDHYESQRANRNSVDFMARNTDFPVRPLTVDDVVSDHSVELVHCEGDDNSSADIVTRTVVSSDDEDGDDEIMVNLDFEELFKSQRADRFIEKYSEEIAAERPKVNHSVVVRSDGGKKVEMGHKGEIDYSVLFKNQRSNGYIEDFMIRETKSRVCQSNAGDHVVRHLNGDHSIEDIETKTVVCDDDQDEDDEIMGNIDFEKLYQSSQRSDICMKKEIAAKQQNVDRPIANDGRRSPIVCGGAQKVGISGNQSIGKIDYSVLFKSQRSNGYIEDYMIRRNTGAQVPSAVDRDVPLVDDNDDDQDEDDEVMGNLDFEKLFKSQKVAMVTDGNDKISAKRSYVENGGRKSPIACDDGQKAKAVERPGKVDYSALFKSQRADGYIEDYAEKIVAKTACEKVGVADRLPDSDVPQVVNLIDDDDDVISIKSSPEFFSCRPSKKVVQTKLTGHVRTDRDVEIFDLSSPPPSSLRTATASPVCQPISEDRFPTGGVTSGPVVGNGLLQLLEDDEDDMDFMSIDYNNEVDAAAEVFTQKHRDGGETKTAVRLPLPSVVPTAKPALENDVTKRVSHSTQSYENSMMPFNIMKAARLVDLLKPGLSMKRSTTTAASKRLVDSEPTSAAFKRQVDSGSTSTAFKRLVDTGSTSTALKRQVDTGSTSTAFKRQVDNGSTSTAFKRQVDNGSTTPVFKRKVDNGPTTPVFKRQVDIGQTSTAFKRQVDHGSMAALALKRKFDNDQSPADDMSPIHVPNGPRRRPQFSQSTPKVPVHPKQRERETATAATTVTTATDTVNSLLTSSSDSDAFIGRGRNEKTTSPRRRVKKKRRPKPKKKLLFIDDEADVSNCYGDGNILSTTSSENDDDDDEQNEFDSSFIDDDHEKSDQKSMTKQYLQSVKSQANVRGVFKIPQLMGHHYNVDVYSQMDDRNVDNNYEEDSFCVEDASDLNTSSTTNTSAHRTSDERPSKPPSRKRKRIIMSPQSTDSSDSSGELLQFRRKRGKAKTSLDFS